MLIENKSKTQKVAIITKDDVLNGYMIEPVFFSSLMPGTKQQVSIDFEDYTLKPYGLTLKDVKYTEFVFLISNDDYKNWKSYTTNRIRINV